MERLPDFIRARLRQLALSKPPPKRLLAVLRELAQEYKAFVSDDAARRVVDWQAPGPLRSLGAENGSLTGHEHRRWRLGKFLAGFAIPPDRVIAARFPLLTPATGLVLAVLLRAVLVGMLEHPWVSLLEVPLESLLLSGDSSSARSKILDVGHEFALFHTMKVSGDDKRRWSGMPIRPFLAGRTFEPEQITVMSAAFADTCKALGLSEADHPLTPLVAQHVMGLGQRGVKSSAVLYLLTLEEFRSHRQ